MSRNNNKNQISNFSLHESDDSISDDFNVNNTSLNAGIVSNENNIPQNTHTQNNQHLSPKVKFNYNPRNSKGKEPEVNEEVKKGNNKINLNEYSIPSYKRNYNRQSRNNNKRNSITFSIITKSKEPVNIPDIHEDSENDDPLEFKMDSYKPQQSSTSSYIQKKPLKKIINARSRRLPTSPVDPHYGTFGSYSSGGHDILSNNHQNSTHNLHGIYKLKKGEIARDIHILNEKVKRSFLSKHSRSEPNLYELRKKESEFNMDYLALYGHYGGDDDFDEDYVSESDSLLDWGDEESEEEEEGTESEMNLANQDIYENDIFDDEKIKIIETQSPEVINDEEYDHHNESKLSIEVESMTENTPLLKKSSHSSLNNNKIDYKKYKYNISSVQTGSSSERKTLFLLIKIFISTGILFLPKAFSDGGLLFSLLLLASSSWLTYFSMMLLIRCSERFGKSYGDIGKLLYGRPFKYIILLSIALSQSGSCCALIIFILQSIKSIISTITGDALLIPDWILIVAQILIYIPLSWVRKIQHFSMTSLIADIFILIGLIYILCSDLLIISSEGHSNNIKLFNHEEFPLFFGTAIYAFGGIGLIIPLQRSMKEPEKFPNVLKKSISIVSFAMLLIGGLSYYIFGDEVNTIILMDVFPDSVSGTVVRALYTLAIIFSFPLPCYSGIHIVEPLFIPRQRPFKNFRLKHKRMGSKNYTAMASNQTNTSEIHINTNTLMSKPSHSSLSGRPKRDTGKNSKVIKWMKNIFRAVFVSFLGFIAYHGASNLDNVISIIGSFAFIPITFIYPAMLHYRGVAETSSQRTADIAIIVFGVVSMIWIGKLSLEGWK